MVYISEEASGYNVSVDDDQWNYFYNTALEESNISKSITDKYKRMDNLEMAMKNSIHEKLRFRFLPYIQLNEFESLLLVIKVFLMLILKQKNLMITIY